MSRCYVHNGKEFVSRPNILSAHNGSSLQANRNVWMHNGTDWVLGSQRPFVMVNVPVNNNLSLANRRWLNNIPGTGNFRIRIEFQIMETNTSTTPARSRIRFNLWLEAVGSWWTTATGQSRTFRINVRRNNSSGAVLHTISTTNTNQNVGGSHGTPRHFIQNQDRWITHNNNGSLTIAIQGQFDGPRLTHNTALWAIPWNNGPWQNYNVFGTRQEKRYL